MLHGLRSDDGASVVEYGLIVFAIAAVTLAVVAGLGGVVENLYSSTCDTFANELTAAAATCS